MLSIVSCLPVACVQLKTFAVSRHDNLFINELDWVWVELFECQWVGLTE